MFVDRVKIHCKAGKGGDGIVAFRREKYVALGGPSGGNGGKGGSVIFEVDTGKFTLLDLRYSKKVIASDGEKGKAKKMHGANGKDVVVKVPLGTIVKVESTGAVIADLTHPGQRAIICAGGKGGRGNFHFKSSVNSAPEYCEMGEFGDEKDVIVELKVLADVGLVGLPSVGKSTFISKISAAKPKIAAYHFTTLSPNLGVVKTKDNRSFVVADLPGLIEGASLGEGLGDKFLKHIERTRVIAHIIDMSSFEGRDPYGDYVTINKELENFNPKILNKPQIVIANKMDMPEAIQNLEKFKEQVKGVEVYPISALTNEGVDKVLMVLADMLDKIEKEPLYEDEKIESHILYKFEREKPFTIHKDGDTWVILGKEVEKLLRMTRFTTDEAANRFANKLRKMGIDAKLRELGAQDGDTIRILDFEFEYRM